MIVMHDMDMTEGNLFKKLLFFSVPVMISSIIQLLFNACDLIVVGNFAGNDSLAAVGSTTALINLIVNLFIGFSIGANVATAKAVGANDYEKCQRVVHTSMLFSFFAGIVLMIFGYLTSGIWLSLMDTTIEALPKATIYLQIYFLGMIFNMVYNYGAAILRAVGETKKPLLFLFIAGVINILLNLLFVIVIKMDVSGVALGTIISEGVSSVLVVICLVRREGFINLNFKKLRIHLKELKEIVLIGLPAGIQGALFSISNVFVQKAVNSFSSTEIVAGNTASSNIESFVYSSMNAVYQACLSFTSQNLGAGKIKNCRKVLIYSLILVTTIGVVLGGGAVLLDNQLLRLYTQSDEALKYGMLRLKIICLPYFLCGIMDVIVGGLRGLEYSFVPMIVSIGGVCVFRLIWIYTIFNYYHDLSILYWSYPISWLMTLTIHLICYFVIYKKLLVRFNINKN